MTDQASNPYAPPHAADENCQVWGVAAARRSIATARTSAACSISFPFFFAAATTAILVVARSLLLQASMSRVVSDPILYCGLGASLLILLAPGAAMWWIFYQLAGVTVVLEENALTYRTRRDEKRLPFDDQMLIDAPNHRTYMSGCLRIRSGEQAVRVLFRARRHWAPGALAQSGARRVRPHPSLRLRPSLRATQDGRVLRSERTAASRLSSGESCSSSAPAAAWALSWRRCKKATL